MDRKSGIVIQICIALAGIVLFLPGLGGVRLFDWDEINFAESAKRAMYMNLVAR